MPARAADLADQAARLSASTTARRSACKRRFRSISSLIAASPDVNTLRFGGASAAAAAVAPVVVAATALAAAAADAADDDDDDAAADDDVVAAAAADDDAAAAATLAAIRVPDASAAGAADAAGAGDATVAAARPATLPLLPAGGRAGGGIDHNFKASVILIGCALTTFAPPTPLALAELPTEPATPVLPAGGNAENGCLVEAKRVECCHKRRCILMSLKIIIKTIAKLNFGTIFGPLMA